MCHHGEVPTYISLYELMCYWGWYDAIGMDASDGSPVHKFHFTTGYRFFLYSLRAKFLARLICSRIRGSTLFKATLLRATLFFLFQVTLFSV